MSELLLKHFDQLAKATDGVARLRELILTLAMRGKLVPQDPNEVPASELLQRIRAEKDRLIAEKKIRRSKPLDAIQSSEVPYELPETWAWERLGNLGDWGAGATPSRSNSAYYGGEIPWFKSGELTSDFISESEETVTESALRDCSLRLNQPGDVLIAMYGATIGKTAILSVVATTNQAVCACTPFGGLSNTYLLLLLKALKPYFISLGAGGAQPNISREKIISTVVGLPPLEEQTRIVARVEELMRLCDALEAKRQLDATQHTQLLHTLLGTLTDSATPEELAANWHRVAAHFDLLLDRPEAVDALEQIILQLAVRGLLVPQDPNDEPASMMLQRIRAEKDRLIAEGKIKRDKSLPPIADEEKPFELPLGWEWMRLADVVRVHNGRAYGKQELLESGPTPVLRVGNLFTSKHWYYSNLELESEKYCYEGDLLYAWSASFGPFIWTGPKAIYHYHIWKLEPWSEQHFDTGYFHKFLAEKTAEIKAAGHGVSMIHMTKEKMEKIVVPYPPLAEQSRIVARFEELRQLCSDLRQRLTASRSTQSHLAEALLADAVSLEVA